MYLTIDNGIQEKERKSQKLLVNQTFKVKRIDFVEGKCCLSYKKLQENKKNQTNKNNFCYEISATFSEMYVKCWTTKKRFTSSAETFIDPKSKP